MVSFCRGLVMAVLWEPDRAHDPSTGPYAGLPVGQPVSACREGTADHQDIGCPVGQWSGHSAAQAAMPVPSAQLEPRHAGEEKDDDEMVIVNPGTSGVQGKCTSILPGGGLAPPGAPPLHLLDGSSGYRQLRDAWTRRT
jgi:hypothetical protein